MKKHLLAILVILALAVPAAWAQDGGGNSREVLNASIMRPDEATRDKWYQEYLNAPKSYIDPVIKKRLQQRATKPMPLLLDHITYTPSERNQASCGNCWVWAGTALAETKHSVEQGVKDRLSIQYFDSAYFNSSGKYACDGGNLGSFVSFYNTHVFLPWSNANAHFQDQAGGTAPHVAESAITGWPRYDGNPNAFLAATIPTSGSVVQATAIANIKNVLNQHKAVQFNFWLATTADWNAFFSFWNNQAETALWNPDPYSLHKEDAGAGGHAVTIVGYDDTDASVTNHYWIVLNSWGTTANRPNGLFRLRMYINYKSYIYNPAGTSAYYNLQFQNLETATGTAPFFDTNRQFLTAKAPSTGSIWLRERATGAPWSIWSMTTGTASEAPALATFNSRQYMARKGNGASTSVYVRSMNYTGAWSTWTLIPGDTTPGGTDASPALAVFRNRLYLFIKGKGVGTIYYKSMGTNGIWSTPWLTVAGSVTPYAPSVAVNNDKLHLFQTDGNGKVYMKTMLPNGSWLGWAGLDWGLTTNAGPSATVFDNRVHVVVKGDVTTPNSNKVSMASAAGDVGGGWYTWAEIPGGGLIKGTPRMGTGPDVKTLTVAVNGQGSNSVWTQTYKKGVGWNAAWALERGYSVGAPFFNTYWFDAEPYPMRFEGKGE